MEAGSLTEDTERLLDKATPRAIKIATEESLWFTEVRHLLLSFPIFLVNRNYLRSSDPQIVYLSPLQSIIRSSSCSLSALSAVKHVMIALILGCAHRVMKPFENLSYQCRSLSSAEVLGILQTRENGRTGMNLCHIISTGTMTLVLFWNFILPLSQSTLLTFKRMIANVLLKFAVPKPLSPVIRGFIQ